MMDFYMLCTLVKVHLETFNTFVVLKYIIGIRGIRGFTLVELH